MKIVCDECREIADENEAIRRNKENLLSVSSLFYCSNECINRKDRRSRMHFWILFGLPSALVIIIMLAGAIAG